MQKFQKIIKVIRIIGKFQILQSANEIYWFGSSALLLNLINRYQMLEWFILLGIVPMSLTISNVRMIHLTWNCTDYSHNINCTLRQNANLTILFKYPVYYLHFLKSQFLEGASQTNNSWFCFTKRERLQIRLCGHSGSFAAVSTELPHYLKILSNSIQFTKWSARFCFNFCNSYPLVK